MGKTERDNQKQEDQYRHMIHEHVFAEHSGCSWYHHDGFNFDLSDCRVDMITAIIELIDKEKAKYSGYPNISLCKYGHSFQIIKSGPMQIYRNEDGSVRDEWHGNGYHEHLVCSKCGIDSRLLNNPRIVMEAPPKPTIKYDDDGPLEDS